MRKRWQQIFTSLNSPRGGFTGVAVLLIVLGLLAGLYRGVPITDVDLHDGGVWVTNGKLRLVGHLNYPSRSLDGGLVVASESFDVQQAGAKVAVKDLSASTVASVDTAAFLLGGSSGFSPELLVSYGGPTIAITESGSGKIWAIDITDLAAFSVDTPAVLEQPGSRAVATVDGSIIVIAADGKSQFIEKRGDSFGKPEDIGTIDGYRPDTEGLDYIAIGHQPVVYDTTTNIVHTVEGSVQLPGTEPLRLQATGPENDRVVLASDTSVLYVHLADGEIETVTANQNQASGRAVQPVFFRGCVYAAWMGTGDYLRDCPSAFDDVSTKVDRIADATNMTFRSNRDVIVLNDADTGLLILVNEDMLIIDDWTQVDSSVTEQRQETEEEDTTELGSATNPEENTQPVANPDDFGVRPGRSTWLPVAANDVDPDGDILTVTPTTQPDMGPVQQVGMAESLQIVVPEEASGSDTFSYKVQDGRGGESETQVTLNVHDWSINEAPKPLRHPKLIISQSSSVTYNVVNDWYDPDGDLVYLESAGPAGDSAVDFRPDGTLTIKDLGTAEPGTRTIPVTMTDGRESASYEITLDVRQANQNLPPLANSDHILTTAGQSVTVEPLANDTDPNSEQLRLVNVEPMAGITITPDYASGSVSLNTDAPGTYYLTYSASDNRAETKGLIRFDVAPADAEVQTPAARSDLALVPVGGSTLVDLVANDTDPMGGVLVVQSTQLAQADGLSVQLIDHHLARVSAPAGLAEPTTFTYTVANGNGTSTAEVLVVPQPVESTDQPPVAVDDTATVRAGDVTTIDVAHNDISPVNLALEVDPELVLSEEYPGGVAFVDDNKVRFRAGASEGTATITYTIRDSAGGFSSARVVIKIIAREDANDPPTPAGLQARTFVDTPVRIAVPASGVDPDGDSVTISGVAAPAPQKGSVVIKDGYLEYTPAGGASGSDVFGYSVVDGFGAVGTALVQVGIAAAPSVNQNPYAAPDSVAARQDRLLSVMVTKNDIDPDGDEVQLVPGSVRSVDSTAEVPVMVQGNRIELTTPNQPATLNYYYEVSDGHGGLAKGLLTIQVSNDAPPLPPVTSDDAVTVEQTFDQTSVSVDVLANDEDPDGSNAQLQLATPDASVSVNDDGTLNIPITEHRQMVLYSVTDPDGLSAYGVVSVPGTSEQIPTLRSDQVPVHVLAGEEFQFNLADYIRVRSGHTPRLTFAEDVAVVTGGDGTPPVVDQSTLVFRSTPEFLGATAIQFEVTDGISAEDPEGLKAVVSIPIIVDPNPDANHPPAVQPTQVDVVAGEEALNVDLGQMISDPEDPEGNNLQVSLVSAAEPFEIAIDGLTMRVSVPANSPQGTLGVATIQVSDGRGASVQADVPLRVVASNRPLLAIAPIVINDAAGGKTSTVDLNQYVTDPYAADGQPFTLVGEPTVTMGEGTVSGSGQSITVTPADGFTGQMSVSFRIADATGDPARQVEGTIAVTVRDRPGAPVNVTASSEATQTAVVTWSAGASNGIPITGFKVSWTGEDGHTGNTTVGQVTSTTIDGLHNGVWYTFTVTAINQVGESDPSAPSNRVRPDAKPNQVGTPTAIAGDQSMNISWPTGTTDGAPIDHYEVTISPAPGGASVRQTASTSLQWEGLSNGTAYTFTVVAVSATGLSSEPSAPSAPQTPAGAPGRPQAPNVTKDPVSALPPSATISWTAPDGNGDSAGLQYEVRQTGNGELVCTGSATSCRVTLAVAATNQTFEVRAINKSGKWSEWSAASNAIRPFQPPGPVSNLTVTPTGDNNTVTISFTPGSLNGATSGEVTYYWQAGGARGAITSGQSVTNSVFVNGQNVSVSVYPVSNVNGETSQGDASASVTANAYGPPIAPSVTCSGYYQSVRCSWSGGDGNGRPVVYSLGGAQSGAANGNGETTISAAFNENKQLCVIATQEGGRNAQNCSGGTSWDSPSAVYSQGEFHRDPNFYKLNLTLERWRPNSQVTCYVEGIVLENWEGTFWVDDRGHRSGTSDPGNGRAVVAEFGPGVNHLPNVNSSPRCEQR